MITHNDLQWIYPVARDSDIATLWPFLDETLNRYAVTTPLRQAHFLAQVGHESGQLRYREELASGAAYEGRRDLGNTVCGDGARFKGRGGIQCTGRANYTAYDAFLGLGGQLVKDPRRLAEPRHFWDVAGWFWETHALNALADRDQVKPITKAINGGYNGLPERITLLRRAKLRLIFGVDDIARLQRYLNAHGSRLAVDGTLGPVTLEAVAAFLASGRQLPVPLE